jgi:putative ABC transport system ATP-binding protein
MIALKNISLFFNKGESSQVAALDGIDLIIQKNEFITIVGSNGSGKSSLLNVIAGTVKPDSGSIFINDHDIIPLADYRRSLWIARIFQNPFSGTASDMTVIENFRLASLRTKNKSLKTGIDNKFRNEVEEKISMLGMGLETKLDQSMGSLSGGQRQALTLIMAVMDKAEILLMDEPSSALDPRSSEILMENADRIIRSFGLTTLLVTHSMKDAHRYGSRLVQMSGGKIIRDTGKVAGGKPSLMEIYSWF